MRTVTTRSGWLGGGSVVHLFVCLPVLLAVAGGCGGASGGAGEADGLDRRDDAAASRAAEEQGGLLERVLRREPEQVTVPAGTLLAVRFDRTLSSHGSEVGQAFTATVQQEVAVSGKLAIPAGTNVLGTVSEASRPRKVGGRARLGLAFHSLALPSGETLPMAASFSTSGKSEAPKDAAIIAGGTIGGALLGEAVDEGDGGVLGAVIGGLAGTTAAIKTKGKPVEIPAGSTMTLELSAPLRVTLS